MFATHAGRTRAYCDGLSRRSFLKIGVAGMASAGLADVLRAKAMSAALGQPAKDTSVILVWLDGGPSHMDTYDMKPEAPAEYRGIWRPIKTNVSGFEISELFPRQAKLADKFSVVRSLYHNDGDHFGGAHRMLTGRPGANGADQAGKSPGIGAIAARVCGPRTTGMPAYAAIPFASSVGLRPGYFGGNYVGREFNPFETDGDPNAPNFKVQGFQLPPNLTLDRLESRRALRQHFDRLRQVGDLSGTMEAMDRFQRQAFEFVAGGTARKAFDIDSEADANRDRYGRNNWGQSALLARRLVEAGSTFVTLNFGGWDHHWDLQQGLEDHLPKVDMAVSGLLTDLSERGLSERVLVVMCGEFGRTPRMNDGMSRGTPGRDHWGNAMFCLLAGGGVKGGRIIGSTNRLGEAPKDCPVTPQDIHATIYSVLGVDPSIKFLNHSGRPVPAIDNGRAISELF
ncbi:MAG TPA: DUF1501 domain-containing protein [Pirellulales bacterium]|jgi:hypothetical protein|nr:DUF1501 domain-containing protein [Pirellulales bacterium]